MSLRVLVVDDEAPARLRLRELLGEIDGAECIGEAGSGDAALELARRLHPDVVLLDIRMPGPDGLETARRLAMLPTPPKVVFTTAFEQHALAAFDADAAGYLLKPVRRERLAALLQRLAPTSPGTPDSRRVHVTARLREQLRLIPIAEVYCFQAEQKYTVVRHRGGEDLIEDSLRSLEEEFGHLFVRVHRKALVAIDKVESLDKDDTGQLFLTLRGDGGRLPVSRRLAAEVQRRLR
ncbi:MAG: LytR/AlgR family response regulator transcription factor [Steroidobacteraceae bacterium]